MTDVLPYEASSTASVIGSSLSTSVIMGDGGGGGVGGSNVSQGEGAEGTITCNDWVVINPNETIELLYMICRGLCGLAAMLGNILILLSVIRFKYLKKASAYYLCNMALADFLLGLVGATYPLRVNFFSSKTSMLPKTINFIVFNFAVYHSMFSMVIVAADRFIFICFPLTYEMNQFATKPHLFILASILWTALLIALLTRLQLYHPQFMETAGSIFDLGYFILAVIALFVLYGAILRVVYTQRAREKQQTQTQSGGGSGGGGGDTQEGRREASRQIRVIRGYIFIVSMFITTYVFANVMIQIRFNLDFCSLGYTNTSLFYFGLLSSFTLQSFNSVCNPIVYSYCLNHFRKAFKRNIVEIATCCRVTPHNRDVRSRNQNAIELDVEDDRQVSKKKSNATTASILTRQSSTNLVGKDRISPSASRDQNKISSLLEQTQTQNGHATSHV